MTEFGVDLDYRPSSYFWPLDLNKHLLTSIKGDLRREFVRGKLEENDLDSVSQEILHSDLEESERLLAGRFHPAFMGGEYLPEVEERELEIARITIASTTYDVTVVRATLINQQIHYRVVDEYDDDTLSNKTECTSSKPLTLGELEAFLNGAWTLFDVLDMNFQHVDYDLDSMLDFVMPSSEFYPDFGTLYHNRIIAWRLEKIKSLGLED
ncbi:MAG: hypothetical protein N0E58_19380 [Candidatus Thiodiazotropha endolucinida]|uniref:Uncharacterized protein n=1 Tax=Candidatus Thiodiazotropha taylori TaxID=2792791 RepID=A0A9E4TVX2_9GAMM|nr:hypothetical protein [Candidatus Thiodiazotropha taylori]MCW4238413.1 hypothetical protein [Candidatus Thiodiazotropha endolucinida]